MFHFVNRHRPRVNGARGVALLGFGAICILFGIAYLGGPELGMYHVWPPIPPGLEPAAAYGGLRLWGFIWGAVGFYLLWTGFREDQSLAMGGFAFMCSIWSASYTITFFSELFAGEATRMWLPSAVFTSMLVACLGIARMLNAPPLKVDLLRNKVEELERKVAGDGGS